MPVTHDLSYDTAGRVALVLPEWQRVHAEHLEVVRTVESRRRAVAVPQFRSAPGEGGVIIIGEGDGLRPRGYHAECAGLAKLPLHLILEAVVVRRVERRVHRDVCRAPPFHTEDPAGACSLSRVRIVL